MVAVLSVAVVGCGEDEATTTNGSGDDPDTDVVLTMSAESSEDGTVSIEGTATVPDGALVFYEVATETCGEQDLEVECSTGGSLVVADGRFNGEVDTSDFPSGDGEVWVGFQLIGDEDQPEAVVDIYGPMGESISGPDVVEISPRFRRVEATQAVTIHGVGIG